jgi:hypothetical protein
MKEVGPFSAIARVFGCGEGEVENKRFQQCGKMR